MQPQILLLLSILAGWMNRKQQKAIDYLMEENRVLREMLGQKRLPLTDASASVWREKGSCSDYRSFVR